MIQRRGGLAAASDQASPQSGECHWWLYLLVCRDGRTYAGIATDVAARFDAHRSGKGAKFTRSNPPVRVLGKLAFASKSEALKAEAALKTLDRSAKLTWARKCSAPGCS